MKTQSPDTSPEAEQILIEGFRRMTIPQKMARLQQMSKLARTLALQEIRRRYPDADDQEMRLRLASRWIPANLMRKAFGWDPDERGY